MRDDEIYKTPDGEEFCEKSLMLDPEGKKWNVSQIENWPQESETIKVTLSGDGNPLHSVNVNDMSGWKVVQYDQISETISSDLE